MLESRRDPFLPITASADPRSSKESDFCEKRFEGKSEIRLAEQAAPHRFGPMKRCDQCYTKCVSEAHLRIHKLKHSTEIKVLPRLLIPEPIKVDEKKTVKNVSSFSCEICKKVFATKSYLEQHLANVHTKEEPVSCRECSKTFKTGRIYRAHLKTVHGDVRRYGCESCGFRFASPKDLRRHFLTHSKVKEFRCPQCRRSFTRRDNYNVHLQSHQKKIGKTTTARHKSAKKKQQPVPILPKSEQQQQQQQQIFIVIGELPS